MWMYVEDCAKLGSGISKYENQENRIDLEKGRSRRRKGWKRSRKIKREEEEKGKKKREGRKKE